MDIDFLSAPVPLVKRFTQQDGKIEKTPYPFVKNFTSHRETIHSITDFHEVLVDHAVRGHSLLKGLLSRPINNESRAGLTNPTEPTQWFCLDIDGIKGFDLPEILDAIGLGDTQLVAQYSASHGIDLNRGLSAHVFGLLPSPQSPADLKAWVMSLNLRLPLLNDSLRLTRTKSAMRWTLDVSVNQNDKILYIAPPQLRGLNDPLAPDERIFSIPGSKPHFDLPSILPERDLQALVEGRINELRKAEGLPARRSFNVSSYKGTTVLGGVEATSDYEVREQRGFSYLNIRGGDSWGYYHPTGNPDILFNFKGEPNYKIAQLLPEYYEYAKSRADRYNMERADELREAQLAAAEHMEPRINIGDDVSDRSPQYFVFRDIITARYYNGRFDPISKDIELYAAQNRTQLMDFCAQHGLEKPEFIPDWKLVYDPTSIEVFDKETKRLNTYRPTKYRLDCDYNAKKGTLQCPPTIYRLLGSLVGDDDQVRSHLLKWLGYIWQYQQHTGTAWVFQGITGTGKGTFVHSILTPLFGHRSVVTVTLDALEEQFNGFMEAAQFVFVDESDIDYARSAKKVTSRLNTWITEPMISVRGMHAERKQVTNYMNWMFGSNQHTAMWIKSNDRRFNVAPRQEKKLGFETLDFQEITKELQDFANYLQTIEVTEEEVRYPLYTDAWHDMVSVTIDTPEEVVNAIKAGDFGYFIDLLPSDDAPIDALPVSLIGYKDVLRAILQAEDGLIKLHRDQLQSLFKYACGWDHQPPAKFSKAIHRYGLRIDTLRIGDKVVRGLATHWHISDELRASITSLFEPKSNDLRVVRN